jgi:hypothetical protein
MALTLMHFNSETQISAIEGAFQEFTSRKDIAILLINQHACTLQVMAEPPLTLPYADRRENQIYS